MGFSLAELAQRIGARLRGDGAGPIEGLAAEDAATVLEAFGFAVFKEKDFAEMSEARRIREFYLAEGTALVLGGAGPFDYLTVFRKKGAGGEGAEIPPR